MGRRASQEVLEYWCQQIEQYETSGQTREEYCAAQGIKVYTLDYWRRKVTQRAAKQTASASWIPVKIIEEEAATIELKVGKVQIKVRPGFSPALLNEVLRAIAV